MPPDSTIHNRGRYCVNYAVFRVLTVAKYRYTVALQNLTTKKEKPNENEPKVLPEVSGDVWRK